MPANYRILIVEDDSTRIDAFSEWLNPLGHTVHISPTALEASRLLQENVYDLIFLDQFIDYSDCPFLDDPFGTGLTKWIVSERKSPNAFVFIHTNHFSAAMDMYKILETAGYGAGIMPDICYRRDDYDYVMNCVRDHKAER